ncbi:hypothetical protein [uncultured Halomonas sp.]|uniref:hypothetical protein n=1 Tax=uncultured Halomonas sp. TaxID=173971 RepID=UPI002608E601|nr:hypothetical protein [uncultured Halomonas sp.]
MSKRYDQQRRTIAKAAYSLRKKGATNNEIAERLGISVEQVPARVKLGERLADAGI